LALDQRCARCGGALQAGFAAVVLDGTTTPLFWIAGAVDRERLTRGAKLEGRDRLAALALRCEQCGRVEWQAAAPEAPFSPSA
jgi:hypothetical protein